MRGLVLAAALAASCPRGALREESPSVVPLAAHATLLGATSAKVTLELELGRESLHAREVLEVRYTLRSGRRAFATGLERLRVPVPPRTTTRLEVRIPVRTLEPLEWGRTVPVQLSGQLLLRSGADEVWLPFEGPLELTVDPAS